MGTLDISAFKQKIFTDSSHSFDALKDLLWEYQRNNNKPIQKYTDLLPSQTQTFIPIEFFKHFALKTGEGWQAEAIFESSGTTGQQPSRHLTKDLDLYKKSTEEAFFRFFPKQSYKILALLPSYLERGNSSLVYMVQHWIESFGLPGSGFYLDDFQSLRAAMDDAKEPIILIGVSFALLDFAEAYPGAFPEGSIVIETGGMKGRREELVRAELHARLCQAFSLPYVSSEYGMTELMSQAYAVKDGRFFSPPWLKIVITDVHLPEFIQPIGISGRINFIDLANIHSCAFIASDDIGRMHEDGSFEVLGRLDHAEMRGCSLMYM